MCLVIFDYGQDILFKISSRDNFEAYSKHTFLLRGKFASYSAWEQYSGNNLNQVPYEHILKFLVQHFNKRMENSHFRCHVFVSQMSYIIVCPHHCRVNAFQINIFTLVLQI